MNIAATGGSGLSEVFIDGLRAVSHGPGVDTLPAGGFAAANFGLLYGGMNAGPVEAHYDALVVSRAPVGCR